jgi:carbon storage regulator CsrA
MLVLSRKRGENVVCNLPGYGELVVSLLEIRANSVRLGFEAGHDIEILREEIIGREPPAQLALPPAGCSVATEGEKVR